MRISSAVLSSSALALAVALALGSAFLGCAGSEVSTGDEESETADFATTAPSVDALMAYCPTTPGSQTVAFTAYFSVDPDELFPYLSYADKIAWLGPFHVSTFGSPLPYGEGSVRTVGLNSAPIVQEEIFHYDFPNELVYGVTKSATYKNHCGVMQVTPMGLGSKLTWTVRFDAKGGSGEFLRSFTQSYLNGRLNLLKSRIKREFDL